MDYRAMLCPHCGRENQVPAELAAAVCAWCGQRFESSPPAPEDTDQADALFAQAVDLLGDDLTRAADILPIFNKKLYPEAFKVYCGPLFTSLDLFDRAYAACPGRAQNLVADYAEEYGRRILANLEQTRGTQNKENYVYLYIAFALPGVAEYGRSYCDEMADRLLDTWNRKFPKRKLQRATFEQINSGFKHRFCFITTAATRSLGMGDDCYELNAFRRFRDEYLARQPGGDLEIMEYYLTAPAVVAAIDASPCRDEAYRDIWQTHLQKCLRLYEQGRPEPCRKAYRAMMAELRSRWL